MRTGGMGTHDRGTVRWIADYAAVGKVLVDMICVPDWAFEAVGLELRGMGQDTAYHPSLYLTTAQREAVEARSRAPKFMPKAVPTDRRKCPICLEEFKVGNMVRPPARTTSTWSASPGAAERQVPAVLSLFPNLTSSANGVFQERDVAADHGSISLQRSIKYIWRCYGSYNRKHHKY
ncbi:hypothetical protein ZWY2020_006235 [Hordeum vulgare]|nr:hypothetical protein ZWY2020_006235 [Hordeum vulgare]